MELIHGMKITCKIGRDEIKDARLSVQVEGESVVYYVCQDLKEGSNAVDKLGYRYSWYLGDAEDTLNASYEVREVIVEKDIMNTASYCIGDILIDGDGDEYMVLAICDKIVFLSLADDFTSSGVFYTGEELKEYGYKFKGQKGSLIGEEITIKRKGKSYKVKVTEELE